MRINNPTEITQLLPPNLISRDLLKSVSSDFTKKEIQIIYGPRQVGKSTLMYSLMQKVLTPSVDMFYFNLDFPDAVFNSPKVFIADVQSKRRQKKNVYVFIDEVQRKKDIGLFLKYIYDRNLGYKFVVTGSSSLHIKNITKESLTGRKFEYQLHPLSLAEILHYKGINPKATKAITPNIDQVIEDYLIFGGYPDIINLVSDKDKTQKLNEITESYITRDLTDTFNIKSSTDLNKCAIFLAQNVSSLLSKENISRLLSITVHQVNNYLEALEKSFITTSILPFYQNPTREVSHRPKIYFIDNGIRNSLLRKLARDMVATDKGKLFEQTVLQTLLTQTDKVNYWRNTNQTEVDFIIKKPDGLIAIESKYTWNKSTKTKSLASFESNYQKQLLWASVIHKNNLLSLNVNSTSPLST